MPLEVSPELLIFGLVPGTGVKLNLDNKLLFFFILLGGRLICKYWVLPTGPSKAELLDSVLHVYELEKCHRAASKTDKLWPPLKRWLGVNTEPAQVNVTNTTVR